MLVFNIIFVYIFWNGTSLKYVAIVKICLRWIMWKLSSEYTKSPKRHIIEMGVVVG